MRSVTNEVAWVRQLVLSLIGGGTVHRREFVTAGLCGPYFRAPRRTPRLRVMVHTKEVTASGLHTRVEVVSGQYAGKDILPLNTTPFQLATTNVTFANGSQLLIGDNSSGTASDDAANSLLGTSGRDFLSGFGGDDTLNGGAGLGRLDAGLGNDTYILSSGDILSDAGGIDHVQTAGNGLGG
jgi:Ca2+-binding RTX toxin-like protein